MHKENVDTDNKLVYKPMYPGFQSPDKHPDGYVFLVVLNHQEVLEMIIYGKKEKWKERCMLSKTKEERSEPPIIELDTYKGIPEPTYKTDSNNNNRKFNKRC